VIKAPIPQFKAKGYKMASRRSARLSEASPNLKQASSTANDMPPPKVANISKKRKTSSKDDVPDAAPSTPKRKKATKPVPPMTPTPSVIGLMTAPYSSADIDDSVPPPLNRLAVPNGTNAPLVTPETHRVIANKAVDQVSPSKKGTIKSTTGTLLGEALTHLVNVEPRLKPIIEKHHCHVFSPEGLAEEIDPFRSLVSGIISQQVCYMNSVPWTLLTQSTGFWSSSQEHQSQIRSSIQQG
jgi:DNA-3-methyladenine glycosylase II